MAKSIDISKIDANLASYDKISEPDVKYFDVREEPFQIYGLYDPKGQTQFKRMPDDVAKATNPGVVTLYTNTAGGRVRFSTDSQYVVIKALMPTVTLFGHMTRLGVHGFDMYIDDPKTGRSSFYGSYIPPKDIVDGYEGIIKFQTKETRHITLNLPLYNDLTALYIGLAEGSYIGGGAKYANELPVVFYGSSITQGGCASRPGNCYQNMISRRLNMHYINLGFSGSGKAEDVIVDYMAGLEMSAFVSDYDHNAPTPEYLAATHYKMYEKIRAAHPDIPYIMITRPDFHKSKQSGIDDSIARRDIIMDSFRKARAAGDKNVYFIDGESFFAGELEDSCTVDGCHPNDLGFSKMADVIGNCLCKLKL